jgi:hypothetical protein
MVSRQLSELIKIIPKWYIRVGNLSILLMLVCLFLLITFLKLPIPIQLEAKINSVNNELICSGLIEVKYKQLVANGNSVNVSLNRNIASEDYSIVLVDSIADQFYKFDDKIFFKVYLNAHDSTIPLIFEQVYGMDSICLNATLFTEPYSLLERVKHGVLKIR